MTIPIAKPVSAPSSRAANPGPAVSPRRPGASPRRPACARRKRQALYSTEIAGRLLGQLRDGHSLRAACRERGMPAPSTVLQWVKDDQNFAALYQRARQTGNAKTGQPPFYSAEIVQRILDELASGRTLTEICSAPGMPSRSLVQLWAAQNRDDFAARYRQAKETGGARPGARSVYSVVIADWILEGLADERTLADICRDPGMPAHATVRQWAAENREGFATRYRRAREFGYDMMLDRMVDIADDARGDWTLRRKPDGTTEYVPNPANLRRSELCIKTLRWALSNALPKKRRR
jgi:hypothetical protein